MQKKYVSMRKVNLNRDLRSNWEREYQNRIQSPSALVFDFRVGEHPLFVILTPQLHKQIVEIYKESAILSKLQSYDLPEIARQWYIKKILVDEIKLTNDMENVHSTRREVKDAVDSIDMANQPHNVRFYGMASKYYSLLNHAVDDLKTCADVRKLYDELVSQEVSEENPKDNVDGQIFRKNAVYIQDTHGKIVHEGVYPESEIIVCMERALSVLYDQEVDSLIRVCVFHYLFGYIHPFYNGNGRLSRFITSMILSNELNTFAGLRLSYVIKDHKRQYDNSFKEANDSRNMGDLTDFVENFLGYVSTALQDMIDTLQSGSNAIENIRQIISRTNVFAKHADIIEILALNGIFAEDYLSIEELMSFADCGRRAVQNALDTASDAGALTRVRQGHKYLYTILPDVWPVLAERFQQL